VYKFQHTYATVIRIHVYILTIWLYYAMSTEYKEWIIWFDALSLRFYSLKMILCGSKQVGVFSVVL